MLNRCAVSVLIFIVFALSNNASFGQKLYLFSEGDVHDQKVGKCVSAGIFAIADSLKMNMPSNRIVQYNDLNDSEEGSSRRWTGPDISTSYNVHDDILEAIEHCPAGSNDTIFFYWCGHGAFDEGGHFLWMPKNRGQRAMRRSEILNALKRKNPRLVVFITESCHVIQPFPGQASAPSAPSAPPCTEVPPLFQTLFFEYAGVVDVNSSSPGQSSGANENGGGPFTYCLSSMFQNMSDQTWSWKEVFNSIDSIISEKCSGSDSSIQKVYIWSLPEGTGHRSESRKNDWSNAIYQPENGDRIIAVNEIKIGNEADFRSAIRNAKPKVVLTIIDQRTGNRYYMVTKLLPQGSRSRLGIYVQEDNGPGVVVTGVLSGMPGSRCRFLNNGDTKPVGGRQNSDNSGNSNSGGWSDAIYQPEYGDRIIEVNGRSISGEADFRQAVARSPDTITMTLIEHGNNRCHLRTQLWPQGNETRLGIYVADSSAGGVVVTGVMAGSPGMRCRYKSE
ncbi:MAG: caspase family protein [Thermoguttaceae bacterium]|nr:caspase family protein [Thermoguttaceae bacterium]